MRAAVWRRLHESKKIVKIQCDTLRLLQTKLPFPLSEETSSQQIYIHLDTYRCLLLMLHLQWFGAYGYLPVYFLINTENTSWLWNWGIWLCCARWWIKGLGYFRPLPLSNHYLKNQASTTCGNQSSAMAPLNLSAWCDLEVTLPTLYMELSNFDFWPTLKYWNRFQTLWSNQYKTHLQNLYFQINLIKLLQNRFKLHLF